MYFSGEKLNRANVLTSDAESTLRTTEESSNALVQMDRMLSTIREVGAKSGDTTASMNHVSESVGGISQFIGTVTGIAEEVRKPVEESNGAVKEVQSIIAGLQASTNASIRFAAIAAGAAREGYPSSMPRNPLTNYSIRIIMGRNVPLLVYNHRSPCNYWTPFFHTPKVIMGQTIALQFFSPDTPFSRFSERKCHSSVDGNRK